MFTLKPTDRLVKLEIASDDVGTTGAFNIGTYTAKPGDGSIAFTSDDPSLFATAFDVSTAAVSWTNVMHESGTVGIEYAGAPMWEIANLGAGTHTVDDKDNFVLVLTPSAATTDTFDVVLRAEYIAGD